MPVGAVYRTWTLLPSGFIRTICETLMPRVARIAWPFGDHVGVK
jgi:hypothetical protein